MPHDNRNRARTLPDEILVRIFDFFTAHVGLEKRLHQGSEADATPDYHTLSCVTKVSRHFHRLARPVLYRLVVLHESTTCALLFRTLLERPKVGHLVKGLSLHVIDIKSLECILSRCTSIRSLIVSWGEEQASDVKLNYREIGTVLRNHCITLETLVLNPVKSRPVHEAGEDGNSIGPLGKLCQLKRLAIDSNALLGHSQYLGGSDERKQKLQDLLPVSLEVLHLSFPIGAVKTGEKALYQLLDCAGATVPQLRQVSVDDRNVRFRKDFETLGWTRTGLKEVHNEMPYHSGCFYPILTRSARAQLEPAHTTDGMV
ncbi:hypothetical protein Micbo1qcDRAFT_233227 [Microdochium bolleyi]|uniref:Uncharacterized protein n=1 Tax=Microdochium bolleyi TaxID=196109 RepID=A0A136J431_9PEZI|nr:hypothetical protein Micbo1qcDRAFT_233227 [Microdochium bolleyi]